MIRWRRFLNRNPRIGLLVVVLLAPVYILMGLVCGALDGLMMYGKEYMGEVTQWYRLATGKKK